MLVLMGVILSVSIFVIAAVSADIANINTYVPLERSTSLLTEYSNIKEEFGIIFNYNLAEINFYLSDSSWIYGRNSSVLYIGNFSNITNAFETTRDSFYKIQLQNGNYFNATLLNYSYVTFYFQKNAYLFNVKVKFILSDGKTSISEDVSYIIKLNNFILDKFINF